MNNAHRNLDSALISVVLPCFNEAEVLEDLVKQIEEALRGSPLNHEIVFVNDGSTDGSGAILDRLAKNDSTIRVVHLSRNFGHQAAVQSGVAHAVGDAIVVMDSDLQDDPNAILLFVAKWLAGYDVVYAIRTDRKEAWWKRCLFSVFYRILNRIASLPIPRDAGNFGLVDRVVANQLLRLSDQDRYYPGLRQWVGFRQTGVPVERLQRYDGTPRVSLLQLFRLAKSAIFSFSTTPLAFFYSVAMVSLLVFVGLSAFALYHRLVTDLAIPGWASTTMVSSFFGALNALGIAVLGEYVVRIYDQVRGRPHYIVARRVNFAPSGAATKGNPLAKLPASPSATADSLRIGEPTNVGM
jgi:dolichol-phosphate mannosyltransferase